MKNNRHITLSIFGLIFLYVSVIAQTNEWKKEKTKDGKISVKSNISERVDERGTKVQLIEYMATTTAQVSLANCLAVLKDVSKHKDIIDEKVSKKVKTLSENEWVVYYYFDAPWPMSDADCVSKMTLTEDASRKSATFTLTAAPSLFDKQEVDRMTYYNVTYTFRETGTSQVEMTVLASMSPAMQAPEWMVRTFFPEGPGEVLRRITKLAAK